MSVRKLPLVVSLTLLTIGAIGITATRSPIEVFLCAELVTISTFYVFFTVIIPALRPSEVNTEKIFLGGVAKSPYISPSELYRPGLPLISENIDTTWDFYYDRNKLKPNNREVKDKN